MENGFKEKEYYILEELKRLSSEVGQLSKYLRAYKDKEEKDMSQMREDFASFKGRVYGWVAVMSFLASGVLTFGTKLVVAALDR